jgi:hypothetical protein
MPWRIKLQFLIAVIYGILAMPFDREPDPEDDPDNVEAVPGQGDASRKPIE